MATAFVISIAARAGGLARSNGVDRKVNPFSEGATRAAWWTGWDEQDEALEESAALNDEAMEKQRDCGPDGAGGGS